MAQLRAALDLLRRLPPGRIEDNLADLVELAPDIQDDLLAAVDQPLHIQRDSLGREFLTCDYNRDGDSFRSPWTNEFVPPLADGEASALPSARMRQLEQLANATFDVYREQYYDGGVSSAYFWDLDGRPADFAACVCFRKDAAALGRAGTGEGRWDAVHVFEVAARGPGESCSYKLTSTVMLSVATADAGELKLAGSITRQGEREEPAATPREHVLNMGRQLEEMENRMRDAIVHVYIGRSAEVVSHLRRFDGGGPADGPRRELQGGLAAALAARGARAE